MLFITRRGETKFMLKLKSECEPERIDPQACDGVCCGQCGEVLKVVEGNYITPYRVDICRSEHFGRDRLEFLS